MPAARQGGAPAVHWLRAALAALAAVAALVGPARAPAAATAPQASAAVVDDRGRTVALARAPRRIVTLLPSLTETVCAIDACERLVGTDRYSNWPPAVRALPKLGGLDDAALEAIVALAPELVLAGRSARVIGRLEALGIPVAVFEPETLAAVPRVADRIARLVGQPGRGAEWGAAFARRLDAAAARIDPAWHGARVYFEVESAPYAAGAASFIGELLARLGLGNIAPVALGPYPKLSPEYVVRAEPQLVIATRRAIAEMPGRPGWSTLAALAAGRVCAFDEARFDLLVRPGPRLADGADAIAACLAALPPPR